VNKRDFQIFQDALTACVSAYVVIFGFITLINLLTRGY